MIYYFLPFISFFTAILNTDKRKKRFYFGLIFFLSLFIVLIGAFRGEGIGSDYYSYLEIYNRNHDIEPGFKSLISLFKIFSLDYRVFLFFIFILSLWLKIIAFEKLSPFPFIALMIYLGFWFLVYDINGIRQGIALSFTTLAVLYLYKGNKKYYYILSISAVFIHYSAILFIPLAFITKITCTNTKSIIVVFASYVIAITGLFDILLEKFLSIAGINYFAARIVSYSVDDNYNGNILLSLSTFHRILIYIIILFTLAKAKIPRGLKNILLWCATLGISIYFVFSGIEIIATRLSLYFRFIECISLSYIPTLFSKYQSKYVCFLILLLYVELQVYQTISMPHGNLLPYTNLLF